MDNVPEALVSLEMFASWMFVIDHLEHQPSNLESKLSNGSGLVHKQQEDLTMPTLLST
jgi:hypothetical protein